MDDELKQLRKLYPDEESASEFVQYEKDLKNSSLLLNLLQHDGFKKLIVMYEDQLDRINKQLVSDSKLFESEESRYQGLLLHARKQWIKDFLKPFVNAKITDSYTRSKIKSLLTPQENEN